MADDPNAAAREQALAAGQAAKARSQEEFAERTKGKPTPTQEENDRAALGEHIAEHEHDGANPDELAQPLTMDHRHQEAGSGASYRTRQATAQPTSSPRAAYPAGSRTPPSGSSGT
jgi:hypothetical protein